MRESADDRCFKWNEVRQCLQVEDDESGGDNPGMGMGNNPGMGMGNNPGMGMSNGMGMGRCMGVGNNCTYEERHEERRGAIRNCTEGYVECARDRFAEDLTNLPGCARESLEKLAQCSLDNIETCSASCRAQRNNTESMVRFPNNFNPQSLRRCGTVRNRIFRPLCRRASCCDECYEALEEVNRCFLEEVVEVLPRNGTCIMNCPTDVDVTGDSEDDGAVDGRLRFLRQESHWMSDGAAYDYEDESSDGMALQRYLVDDETEVDVEDSIYEACIELAPGVDPNTRGDPEEVVNQADFFDCVMDNVVQVVTDESLLEAGNDDSSATIMKAMQWLTVATLAVWILL